MALVAYDDSDISESDQEEEAIKVGTNSIAKEQSAPHSYISDSEEELSNEETIPARGTAFSSKNDSLASKLPQPKNNEVVETLGITRIFKELPKPTNVNLEEEDDEILHKKEVETEAPVKPKAKITIPSLSDFKDVESGPGRPQQPSKKGSGLLSMLPQPKHSPSFSKSVEKQIKTPASQTKATTTSTMLTPTILKKQSLKMSKALSEEKMKKPLIDYNDEDSDTEDTLIDVKNDYFSFSSAPCVDEYVISPDIEEPPIKSQKVGGNFSQTSDLQDESSSIVLDNVDSNSYEDNSFASTINGPAENCLDEEAMRRLCGSRGRARKEEIQFIDVNQEEVLADARELLLKGLTDDTSKRPSSSKRKGNEPTSQQKRKHQITYLAHQAKANEADLQNQWSNNRLTRRQTQSKYGF